MSKLTLEEQLHHLGYEWWMFRTTHSLLARLPPDDDPVRNALIESMALHGRALFCFFCKEPTKDDFGVEGLGIDMQRTEEPILDQWKLRADKYVAHLTETGRRTPTSSRRRPWGPHLQQVLSGAPPDHRGRDLQSAA